MHSLTTAQIQTILDFTRKKYVKFYDVQIELVDHIAHRIEELQALDPHLSFDQALHKVYKSFGIYGFTKMQEKYVDQVQKHWWRRITGYLLSYFKLPKVLLTIALAAVFFFYINLIGSIIPHSLIIWISAGFISMFFKYHGRQSIKENRNGLNSNLLVVNSYSTVINGLVTNDVILLGTVFHVFYYNGHFESLPVVWIIIGSFVLSFLVITHYALHFVFPTWLEKEVQDRYAHLDIDMATLSVAK